MCSSTVPFIDGTLAQKLEEAHTWRCIQFAQAQARLQPASNSEVAAIGGGYAIYAGPDSPLNKATGLGLAGVVTIEELQQLEAFYHRHNELPRIEVCPLADPSLVILLKERGYRLESFLNVLARAVPDEPLSVAVPVNTSIRRATPDQAEMWTRTTTQGFEGNEEPSPLGLAIQAATFHSQDTLCFLAWVDMEPAAGGAMAIHDKVIELGGTSTRLAYRRRGLQSALIHTRINVARELGCVICHEHGGSRISVTAQH